MADNANFANYQVVDFGVSLFPVDTSLDAIPQADHSLVRALSYDTVHIAVARLMQWVSLVLPKGQLRRFWNGVVGNLSVLTLKKLGSISTSKIQANHKYCVHVAAIAKISMDNASSHSDITTSSDSLINQDVIYYLAQAFVEWWPPLGDVPASEPGSGATAAGMSDEVGIATRGGLDDQAIEDWRLNSFRNVESITSHTGFNIISMSLAYGLGLGDQAFGSLTKILPGEEGQVATPLSQPGIIDASSSTAGEPDSFGDLLQRTWWYNHFLQAPAGTIWRGEVVSSTPTLDPTIVANNSEDDREFVKISTEIERVSNSTASSKGIKVAININANVNATDEEFASAFAAHFGTTGGVIALPTMSSPPASDVEDPETASDSDT
ncbi:hypothetical protein DFP72DRAFT_842962 [Ephemerocybe angulata]|uniref:Uncharacterized protein n=1 Tax=Ephemerocybe angulata TaxID=980116 RepID=A0A8H6I9J0_9AGAR|nr:hypothetical protein DFP72DRAFT_842962 [Tulosesus angulatus]